VSGTVVITMAGRGQRFRDAGHDRPKYEISVRGRTLFAWALDSLRSWSDAGADFVFLARREDDARAFVAGQCAAQGISAPAVVELDGTTDGQATTALLAGRHVREPSAPFVVYNIDTHVRPGAMRAEAAAGDGWLPCFEPEGDAWSFARADGEGRVTEVREKVRISPYATVGLYWFSSFALYEHVYAAHFAAGTGEEAGERYIAPMYNTMIAEGAAVHLELLAAGDVVALGTPEDVERFARSR